MRQICENRENYVPRKFGAIQYLQYCVAWQNVKFYHNASLSGLAQKIFLAKHSHHTTKSYELLIQRMYMYALQQ